jgi:hypothetical protein
MTDDQLDEIEKEAKAGGPEDDGTGDIAAFLVDCRILPLVKALREARAHNEKLIEELKETDVRAAEWLGILEKMERERDEAIRLGDERLATLWDEKKVEIKKLTAERDDARERCETEKVLREVAEKFHDVAVKERDQARADVQRLKRALATAKQRLNNMDSGEDVYWVES